MKSLMESIKDNLIVESAEDKIVKNAEKAFKTLFKKTKSIGEDIDPLIKQNFDVVDAINHTDGMIYCTIKDGGKEYTLCLDSEDDWNASKEEFNLKKIVCVPGNCDDDDVIDAMYNACGY